MNEPYEDKDTKPFEVIDRDEYQDFDAYIGGEVLLPYEDSMQTARVRERKREKLMAHFRGHLTEMLCLIREHTYSNSLMVPKLNTLQIL
jgi:hypothetical protein